MSPLRAAALTALAIAGFAHPAQASGYSFARDGMIADIERLWPSDYLELSPEATFSQLSTVGGLEFQLSMRPLSYFAGLYGGEVQHFSNAGYYHDWLCYTSGDMRLWLFTNDGSDDAPRGLVDWLVVETADPAFNAGYGCTEQPLAMLAPGPKVPSIGMTRARIEARYGTTTDKQQNFVTIFGMQYAAPYVTTNVTLRFERDVLTGISLAQGSEE